MISVLVAGPGCYKCNKLADICKEVIAENNLNAAVEKISDLNQITALGVMMTPGLIVNSVVKSSGKIPSKNQIKQWIMEAK